MIKGHRHLKQCAYIGDDSSEELDEIFDGEESNNTSADYDISNKPTEMKKINDGVILEDIDISSHHHPHHKHFHTDVVEEALKKNWKVDNKKGPNLHLIYAEQVINPPNKNRDKDEFKKNPNIVNIPGNEESSDDRVKTSKEVLDEMLNQLRKMGDKGKVILEKINKNLTDEELSTKGTEDKKHSSTDTSKVQRDKDLTKSEDLPSSKSKRSLPRNKLRRRRTAPTIGLAASQLNEHDEDKNTAAEEVRILFSSYLCTVRGCAFNLG